MHANQFADANWIPPPRKTLESREHLRKIFAQDFAIAANFLRRSDFAEGVRALLIDKDNAPNWTAAADSEAVAKMFAQTKASEHFARRLSEVE